MKIDIINIDKIVATNSIQVVTSSNITDVSGLPDNEGIFSLEIFGKMNSEERKINFGYINLKRKFIHPFIYNMMYQMFRNLSKIISGEKFAFVKPDGSIGLTDDMKLSSETGIDFFIDNWSKIKWNPTEDNRSRELKDTLINTIDVKDIFIDKWLIIPAFYRDINLNQEGRISIDEINNFYLKLINYTNANSVTFTASYHIQTAVQNLLVDIHNFLTDKNKGKYGMIRQAVMGKTVDYAGISVISAPRFDSNSYEDQLVPFGYIGLPLYQACAIFYPFIIKGLEDLFYDVEQNTQLHFHGYKDLSTSGNKLLTNIEPILLKEVSSEAIEKLVESYNKDKTKLIRSLPLEIISKIPMLAELKELINKYFKRPLTLTDILYAVASDQLADKHLLSTRYPVTGAESIIINKIKILTTLKTVDIRDLNENTDVTYGKHQEYLFRYPYFPTNSKGEILHSEIKWSDTVIPNNAVLAGMQGDYDGDTFRIIGIFTQEANNEAKKMLKSPYQFLNVASGEFIRGISKEAGLALYMMTKD